MQYQGMAAAAALPYLQRVKSLFNWKPEAVCPVLAPRNDSASSAGPWAVQSTCISSWSAGTQSRDQRLLSRDHVHVLKLQQRGPRAAEICI